MPTALDKIFVKSMGYSDDFISWIDKKDAIPLQVAAMKHRGNQGETPLQVALSNMRSNIRSILARSRK